MNGKTADRRMIMDEMAQAACGGWIVSVIYGYIRVSSRDQNEERQIIALREFGCDMIAELLYTLRGGMSIEQAEVCLVGLRKGYDPPVSVPEG